MQGSTTRISDALSDLFFNHDHDDAKVWERSGGSKVLIFRGFRHDVLLDTAHEMIEQLKELGVPESKLPTDKALVQDFLGRV